MKKLTLSIILIVASLTLMAQKVPDCDTAKNSFTIIDQPCKVKVFKAGKFIGYTEKNDHWVATTATCLWAYKGSPGNIFQEASRLTLGAANYQYYIQFGYPDLPKWGVDNPSETKDKYIIHIKRKQLKWLNDSTAVYSNPKK